MNIFSRTKLMFCAILLAVSVQSPHAQEVPFEPTDNKHLASCLARVAQITNLSQIQRRDCIGVAFHLCTQEPDGDTTVGPTIDQPQANSAQQHQACPQKDRPDVSRALMVFMA